MVVRKNHHFAIHSDNTSAIIFDMGYLTKVQVIERANQTRQYYLICPAPLAQALELEKGEEIDWVVEDRNTLVLSRVRKVESKLRRGTHSR
jgi:hypothetical protein